jgi:catechol 2,3-dioxygenase-like lactoylglutathione lyase family enzyme
VNIIGFSHIQLNTSDVERSRVFYENAFDGKVLYPIMTKDGESVKGYFVNIAPGATIEIQPPRFPDSGRRSAWDTISVETDDIRAACEKVEAAGGVCESAPAKVMIGTVPALSAIFIGLENERIELIETGVK